MNKDIKISSTTLAIVAAVTTCGILSIATTYYIYRKNKKSEKQKRDEKVKEYIQLKKPTSHGVARVTDLWIYPVKSCAGTQLGKVIIDKTGFKYDRNWLIIKQDTNRFVTQREYPQLGKIIPSIVLIGDDANTKNNSITLVLSCSTMDNSISVPVIDDDNKNAELLDVVVWQSTIENTVDQGNNVAEWLTKAINPSDDSKFRLVYLGSKCKRPINEVFALEPGENVTGFSDAYPALLCTEGSLNELNKRIVAKNHPPVPMSRFRPNIVLADGPAKIPFEEDNWTHTLTISSKKINNNNKDDEKIEFRAVKPCDRCKMTTVIAETSTFDTIHNEPLDTLKEFRTLSPPFPETDVYFGQNIVFVKDSIGKTISVGDLVIV